MGPMMRYCDFICSSLERQQEVMDELFEPSEGLKVLTLKNSTFMTEAGLLKSYSEFIELVRRTLLQVSVQAEQGECQLDLLIDAVGAHPRLGQPQLKLSKHSQAEQRNLQQDAQDPPHIAERLVQLNAEYERVYPGLKFVVFVNGRTRSEIIELMQSRISSGRPWFEECRQGIRELCNIAQDRNRQSLL